MKVFKLNEMTKGWFVGGFEPAAFKTSDCEVALKTYPAGFREPKHVHKVATEITAIVSGRAAMNGIEYIGGDIIVISPGQAVEFETYEEVTTVVVKVPGALDDKYVV